MSDEIDEKRIMVWIMLELLEEGCEKPDWVFPTNSKTPKEIQTKCFEKLKSLGLIRQWNSWLELTEDGYKLIKNSIYEQLKILESKPC